MVTAITEVLLGGWDAALEILLVIMALDYVTGVGSAFKRKSVSSSIGYTGLLKKASIIIIVILAAQMDKMIGSSNNLFRNGTALSFAINDALSILENVGRLGIRLPGFLKGAFVKLQQKTEATMNNQTETALQLLNEKSNAGEGSKEEKETTDHNAS